MSGDETFAFSMSADSGRTWQTISAHESRAEMHEHVGRIVASVANQPPGEVAFEVISSHGNGVMVSGGVMRWEWTLA
jgi:hypothetical protein